MSHINRKHINYLTGEALKHIGNAIRLSGGRPLEELDSEKKRGRNRDFHGEIRKAIMQLNYLTHTYDLTEQEVYEITGEKFSIFHRYI